MRVTDYFADTAAHVIDVATLAICAVGAGLAVFARMPVLDVDLDDENRDEVRR